MANHALTANRRTVLSSLAAIGAAAAIPTPTMAQPDTNHAAWDAAMARMRRADKAWRAADDALYAIPRTSPMRAKAEDEAEALVEAFSDTERALLDMPAPDGAALRWKLDRILDGGINGPWTESYARDFIRQTVVDYRRLLGDA